MKTLTVLSIPALLAAFLLALSSCNKEVPRPTGCNGCSDSGSYSDPSTDPTPDPYDYSGDNGDSDPGDYGNDDGSDDGSDNGSDDGSDDGGDDSGGRYHVHRQHAAPRPMTGSGTTTPRAATAPHT